MDEQALVIAAQRGDDRAFEALYRAYHPRVSAYVRGTVRDHGRAEDVTQEVFLSALRRMRSTERPIAFEPWIFAIARNACIDEFRRTRRTHEAPADLDEAGTLAGSTPTPDAALATKLDLDDLRGAFGGLSDQHHEALVLRELDGLSHREIAERLGISQTAVESTLARARRRLAAEYEDIATGTRCLQVQGIIARAVETAVGARETRRLARHVAHCQPCRREALGAGIDAAMLADVPLRRRAARKIAGLLPFPALARLLRIGGDAAPALSEPAHAGWAKAATLAVMVAAAGAGATGVATKDAGERADRPSASPRPSAREESQPAAAASGGRDGAIVLAAPSSTRESGARDGGRERIRAGRKQVAPQSERPAGTRPPEPSNAPSGAATPVAHAPAGDAASEPSGGGGTDRGGGGSEGGEDAGSPRPPASDAPAPAEPPPSRTVSTGLDNTLGGVGETVQGVTDGLDTTLDGVNETLQGSPQGLNDALQGVGDTVRGVTDGLQDTTGGLQETVGGLVGGLLKPRR